MDYELPKDLLKQYNAWKEENVVVNPIQDQKKFVAYCKVIKLTKEIFGEENFKADDPNVALKSHNVNVKLSDVMVEDDDTNKLSEILKLVDCFQMSCTMDGNWIMIDYAVENVYVEA